MTVPDVDTLMTYGGATQDYSPASDILRQRKSQYINQELARGAGMTVTAFRSFVSFTDTSGATSITVAQSVWNNYISIPIRISHTSTGIITLTWPTVVHDDIPSGFPGYSSGGHNVNIRGSFASLGDSTGSHDFSVRAASVTPTTVKVFIRNGSTRALADLVDGTYVNVWVI